MRRFWKIVWDSKGFKSLISSVADPLGDLSSICSLRGSLGHVSRSPPAMDILDAVVSVSAELNLQLKESEGSAKASYSQKFCEGHDTFVSLPTGYGKSMIYGLLPLLFDRLRDAYILCNKNGILFYFLNL